MLLVSTADRILAKYSREAERSACEDADRRVTKRDSAFSSLIKLILLAGQIIYRSAVDSLDGCAWSASSVRASASFTMNVSDFYWQFVGSSAGNGGHHKRARPSGDSMRLARP